MTRSADVSSINCTSCGAGLDVLGGGRVLVHVCPYCGSALDAQDNYQVLRKFTDMPRPETPFRVGMSGEIQGVPFTIIGILGLEERWKGSVWRWADHQLYSPTHGYGYLTVEDGHFTFTRRYREPTYPGWISVLWVETAETRPSVKNSSGTYKYYDTTTADLVFVEGEFNWQPELGARTTTVTAMSHDAVLGFSETGTEREVYRTVYLPHAETCASFGLSEAPQRSTIHRLMPTKVGPHASFLRYTGLVFTLLSLVLTVMVLSQSKGTQITTKSFQISELPVEIPIQITVPDRLAKITVRANVDNSWAYLGVGMSDPDDVPIFEGGRTVEAYSGRDKDGAWSEGSGGGVLFFRPLQVGEHTLELSLEEAETWRRDGAPLSSVSVKVAEGVSRILWMLVSVIVFGALTVYQFSRSSMQAQKRWWGSDWTEEDS